MPFDPVPTAGRRVERGPTSTTLRGPRRRLKSRSGIELRIPSDPPTMIVLDSRAHTSAGRPRVLVAPPSLLGCPDGVRAATELIDGFARHVPLARGERPTAWIRVKTAPGPRDPDVAPTAYLATVKTANDTPSEPVELLFHLDAPDTQTPHDLSYADTGELLALRHLANTRPLDPADERRLFDLEDRRLCALATER